MKSNSNAINSAMWACADENLEAVTSYLDLLTELLDSFKRRANEMMRLRPGYRVIELGCGLGRDAEELARHVVPGGHVVATDLSSELIAQAKARAAPLCLPLEFQVANALDLSFANNSFDAARIERTLQHLANPAQAVREIARVVKPGGRVVALDPDWDSVCASGGDIDVLRAMRRYLVEVKNLNGRAGSLTPHLLQQTGCRDIAIEVAVFPFRQLALANTVLLLADALEGSVQHGWITEPNAHAWWKEATSRDSAGSFCAWISGTIVSATVG